MITKPYIHRAPMTSDLIFKAVFGSDTPESKQALIELLNLILERDDNPIVDLVYKNPFSIAEAVNEKTIIMDINVETSKQELIDIEMQIGELNIFVNRSIYYGCKQLSKSLEKGDDYDKIKPSIVISFIKDKLFPERRPVHSIFTLRANDDSMQLSDILELHYIELGKIDWSARDPEKLAPLEQVGAYLQCTEDPDESIFLETLVEKGIKVISMTDTILKEVSKEERLQYLQESREKAQMDIRWNMHNARKEGILNGKQETAAKMKEEGLPIELIIRCTGLTEKEISEL